MTSAKTIYPLLLPLLVIIIATLMLWKWPAILKTVRGIRELHALLVILPVLPYAVFGIGLLMGWRYNNIGLILAFCSLAVVYFILLYAGAGMPIAKKGGLFIPEAAGFLLPLNLALFSTLTQRRIFTPVFGYCFLLMLLQTLALALVCSWPGAAAPPLLPYLDKISPALAAAAAGVWIRLGSLFHAHPAASALGWLNPTALAFFGAFLFLLMRYLYRRDALAAGFSGTLPAVFFGLLAAAPIPAVPIYFMAGGLILIIAAFEASFSMAYKDELTGLQGRRSLNDTLLNLGSKYAIAMIDVDHFKKFNDTYGHKTGDQVLKMIASRLERISGGAKTFRYGGEEFTAVFPGKTAREAWPYLEEYRQAVSSTPFTVRGKGRRRGDLKQRGSQKTEGRKTVQVTVSIGIAATDKHDNRPEKVLKAADKVLYGAKKAGRNRVMV